MILSPRRSKRRLPKRRAQGREIAAVFARFGRRRCRTPGRWSQERRALAGRAVAVDALDLDGRADFAVELGVAVDVLDEMAIDAVHPFLEVDVEQVHGQAVAIRARTVERGLLGRRGVARAIALLELSRQCDGGHQRRGTFIGDGLAAVIEQVAVPVFLEDRPEDPAVAVEIGELGVSCLRVQVGDAARGTRDPTSFRVQRSRPGLTCSHG